MAEDVKGDVKEEKSEKEKRIRAITKLYYSRPDVQQIMLEFATGREVVPRYFEGFGKRPDSIQYPSDIIGLVNKGATSFHASEEIWNDPLQISSDMSQSELGKLRKSWDLLIDIDSPFLDCSKIAADLITSALAHFGIKNYGIKFSGSKGFHIIIGGKAFPNEFDGKLMKDSFPEWPRAISEFLMNYIKRDYNQRVGEILPDVETIKKRTKLSDKDMNKVYCKKCNSEALKGNSVKFVCNSCQMISEVKNFKKTKRRLRCLDDARCPGIREIVEEREYYYCEHCKDPENDKLQLNSEKHPEMFEITQGVAAEELADLDLVLVASRHLFRMPYSLHEKTALASVVIKKEDLENFVPKDADPMRVKILKYMPENEKDEAKRLLLAALEWKKNIEQIDEKLNQNRYKNVKTEYTPVDFSNVQESMYPAPIKKLMKGLKDGKKRGLFVLMTFLRTIGKSPEEINNIIREWNKLNEPPLKEGYVKSQLDWLFRQKKQILPPNYSNDSFYKDLGLIEGKSDSKNPVVDVMKAMRKR